MKSAFIFLVAAAASAQEPEKRRIPGFPEIQPRPKIVLRVVYRDPFENFRILMPDGWTFTRKEGGRAVRFEGPGGKTGIDLVIERAETDLRAFVDGRIGDRKPEVNEPLRIGGREARRIRFKRAFQLIIAAEGRFFCLSSERPDETVEKACASLRVFPPHELSEEEKARFNKAWNEGTRALRAGRAGEAIDRFREAEALCPNYPYLHEWISRAYEYQKDLKKASAAMARCLELDPEVTGNWLIQTTLLINLHKYAAAIKAALEAVKLEPWSEGTWTNLGLACLYKRSYRKAEGALRNALDINEKYVPAWYNLGVLYEARGKEGPARKAYRKVLEIDPDNARAKQALRRLE